MLQNFGYFNKSINILPAVNLWCLNLLLTGFVTQLFFPVKSLGESICKIGEYWIYYKSLKLDNLYIKLPK